MFNVMSVQLLRQLFQRPFTNPFLAEHMPDDLTGAMEAAARGEISLNEPVETWGRFRGKISYQKDICIGCGMCMKVCPANAIERSPNEPKKIIVHNDRCCFCAQCNDICPVDALSMSRDFAISSYDRQGHVTVDSGVPERKPFQSEWTYRLGEEPQLELSSEQTKEVYQVREEDRAACGACAASSPRDSSEKVSVEK
ncbi:MAG: 4Fe-4S ferredoxin [Dethiosulfovibrio peptidovorans]|nr:MAG: 4Fe-4S ferredoxin [Dethiosulfovibrio peptidovorans]